ncbi:MAG: 4-(cytidine 5'-diphospho)-2-C-methyl-D-erythritol kinase, partial [Candidatus Fimenecus sp.]
SVGCYDLVEVEKTETGRIEILTDDERVPKDEKNIAYKAADAFFAATALENTGISIAIEKHIPMAAGLAGGSADAAGVLYCLDTLFSADLAMQDLQRIGERVGADVPFALSGGTSLCMDKGGVIAPLLPLKGKFVVLCKPQMDVSTVSAYRLLDEAKRIRHADKNAMLYAVHTGDYKLLCEKADNVFEQVIEVPARPVIKGVMRSHGADLTLMSGSGPTVYGLFSDRKSAESCAAELKQQFPETVCCETVGRGVETVSVC